MLDGWCLMVFIWCSGAFFQLMHFFSRYLKHARSVKCLQSRKRATRVTRAMASIKQFQCQVSSCKENSHPKFPDAIKTWKFPRSGHPGHTQVSFRSQRSHSGHTRSHSAHTVPTKFSVSPMRGPAGLPSLRVLRWFPVLLVALLISFIYAMYVSGFAEGAAPVGVSTTWCVLGMVVGKSRNGLMAAAPSAYRDDTPLCQCHIFTTFILSRLCPDIEFALAQQNQLIPFTWIIKQLPFPYPPNPPKIS